MRRHFRLWISMIALSLGWLGHWLVGQRMARLLGTKFSAAILRVGQGKIDDPVSFVYHRMGEALWLGSLLIVWVAIHRVLAFWLHRRSPSSRWHWVGQAAAGFVLLNVWLAFAMRTALFWGVVGTGAGVDNYMQYQLKRVLAGESQAPYRVVLVGSSQTRAQIDENQLNARLGSVLWTTELHFPGSTAHDLLIVEPQLRRIRPHFVICYLSENYFDGGLHGETPKYFLQLSQLPEEWRLGALSRLSGEEIGYGILGNVLPLFRCRDILTQRVLGADAAHLEQTIYNNGLAVDLEARAREVAKGFAIREETAIHKKALELFIDRCGENGSRVILLAGQMNPILGQKLDPALRPDYLNFLAELPSHHPNVVVVPPSELPPQTAESYDDLSHVNAEGERVFTDFMAGYLEKLIGRKVEPPAPTPALH